MKKLLFILIPALCCLISCDSDLSTEEGLPIYVAVLGDPSGSRQEEDRMDAPFMEAICNEILTFQFGAVLQFYNIADAEPRLISFEPTPLLPNEDPYSMDVKNITDSNTLTSQRNEQLKTAFLTNFAQSYLAYSSTVDKDDDYTYLEKHLERVLKNLKDPDFEQWILFIDSDLLDHPKGGKELLISDKWIQRINQAVADGAKVFVYTNTSIFDTSLKNMKVIFLGHYSDFIRKLHDV